MKDARKNYLSDLRNPKMLHIKDHERFVSFYEELGKDEGQKNQQIVPSSIRKIEPVGTILELGCHVGFNLIYFAERGFTVTGVDISSTLLTEAQRRLDKLDLEIAERVTLIHSDILDLKDMGKYDTILLTEVLEHVINPVEILLAAKQYMKPTSKIYVFAPARRVGTYSHVRGILAKWIRKVGHEMGLDFKILVRGPNMKAIGTLI